MQPSRSCGRWRLISTGLTTLCVGALIATSQGCGYQLTRTPDPLGYRVVIPSLKAIPQQYDCEVKGEFVADGCTAVATQDFEALVVELKAACIALGGERDDCWAD